jgi:hypothetical protein
MATAMTPLLNPLTTTGTDNGWVVPSPSSPTRFRRQHQSAPALVSAQARSLPAAMATAWGSWLGFGWPRVRGGTTAPDPAVSSSGRRLTLRAAGAR